MEDFSQVLISEWMAIHQQRMAKLINTISGVTCGALGAVAHGMATEGGKQSIQKKADRKETKRKKKKGERIEENDTVAKKGAANEQVPRASPL